MSSLDDLWPEELSSTIVFVRAVAGAASEDSVVVGVVVLFRSV
jgi:hypothetical protein